MKVLDGLVIAIIAGLITNAIGGEVFKALEGKHEIFSLLRHTVYISQLVVPVLVGGMVAQSFKLDQIETAVVSMVSFIASGNVKATEAGLEIAGIGDLINTLLMVSVAVYVVLKLRGKFGSLKIILLPLIVVTLVGFLGLVTLPYVSGFTRAIGLLVERVTHLQPLLMSVLISIIFSIIIISPISTVAVALAISLAGLGSGAAGMGITAAAAVLVTGSMKVNAMGTTMAVLLGSPKIFMKNWVQYPKLNIPLISVAAITGLAGYLLNIQGTPESAGFGLAGLVGPINALALMEGQSLLTSLLSVFIAFGLVPFVSAFLINKLLVDVLNVFDYEIYKFGGHE